jgi:hypothetical protein
MTRDHARGEREAFLAFCDGTLIQERAVAPEGETLNAWRDELNPRFTGGYEHRLKPMLAPPFDRCECGHSWGQHLAKGCTHWTEGSGYCPCRRTYQPKAMVSLNRLDIRPGDVVRSCPDHWFAVLSNHYDDGIFIVGRNSKIQWDELQRLWQISHDRGKTWQSCKKEAT